MQIFSILARKGGVGKSLVVRSLAVQALLDGKKSAILDADPQETIVSWSRRREPSAPFVIGLGGRSMRDALGEVEGRGGDIVFIDTPPHAQPTINIAAEVADACLLVTGPYPEDLEQVGAVASIVSSLSKPAGIILNKSPPKAHALTLARAALTTFQIPTCPTSITQLVGHPYASAEGLAIQEREPDSKGAREIAAVWEWVKATILPSQRHTITPSHRTTAMTRRVRAA
jgi:chromosome partitioning protein